MSCAGEAMVRARTHLPSGDKVTDSPSPKPHGRILGGLAQVDGVTTATADSFFVEKQALAVGGQLGGKRVIEPGEVLLLRPYRRSARSTRDASFAGTRSTFPSCQMSSSCSAAGTRATIRL